MRLIPSFYHLLITSNMTNILLKERLLFLFLITFLTLATRTTLNAQNTALNFDGVDDYANCGNFLPLTYTKEAWINISDLTKDNNILSGSVGSLHAFWAPTLLNNKLSAGHNGNYQEVQDPTPLGANQWYHVAVTYDAPTTTMILFKNGVEVNRNTFVAAGTAANGQVLIGSFSAGQNLFAGSIDEVRIWNVARTPSQIAANMNTSLGYAQPNLMANYRFNQGTPNGNNTSITSLTDDSGNARNATLFGFGFNGFGSNFVSTNLVVPINLLKFEAFSLKNTVKIHWETATESHNKGFDVERLNMANDNWETLGFVPAQGKAAHYDFLDSDPLSKNYYRLRQIDDDGTATLSKIVSVVRSGSTALKIYPSLVSDVLSIDATGDNLLIINLLGQVVMNQKNAPLLDVSALPQGTYLLKIGDAQAKFTKF